MTPAVVSSCRPVAGPVRLVRLSGVVERQDVGVAEARRDLDLAEKPLRAERGGQLGPEDLYRDLAVVLEVLGKIDRCHPAAADLTPDGIAVGESGSQTLGDVAHDLRFRTGTITKMLCQTSVREINEALVHGGDQGVSDRGRRTRGNPAHGCRVEYL